VDSNANRDNAKRNLKRKQDAPMRPAMTAVAAMLDGSMEVCEPRTEQLAYLRMYG
jgi:hypothetical protein